MIGTYVEGETRIRPGAYFNIHKVDDETSSGYDDGIIAVLFRSDWGPLCTAVELTKADGYDKTFGNGGTTDAIKEAFLGGANSAVCCRVGSGGAKSSVTLTGDSGVASITLTSKYVGTKELSVTVRDALSDETKRECIVYSGTQVLVKVTFLKGGDEASAVVKAFELSQYFDAKVTGTGTLDDVSQAAFSGGADPTVTAEDYSNAFAAVESSYFDTICVDTEDVAIHYLLAAFLDRAFDTGLMAKAVVAETTETALETRMEHAKAYNNEKMIYVLNPALTMANGTMDGYRTAARIAGMVSSYPSNVSLTHATIDGATDVVERLTLEEIETAETMGCLVLTMSTTRQVWIDSAINSLVTPADNQDDGWKKIRRVKTRQELIRRLTQVADNLIGKVDNDTNGRATVVSQMQSEANTMIDESKLVSCAVSENPDYTPDGDSSWYLIDVVDKDSAEHIYLTMRFRFTTQE